MYCRIAEKGSGLGAIEVTRRSMFSGYVGTSAKADPGGWFRTGDLGILLDGELYLAGKPAPTRLADHRAGRSGRGGRP
jgi:acyl-CoA synthetase (AMP-forming)/AMP-acid ligase II